MERIFITLLLDAYDEDVVNNEPRVVLRLHPNLAPLKWQSRVRKDELFKVAKESSSRYAASFPWNTTTWGPHRPALPPPGRDRDSVLRHGRLRHADRPRGHSPTQDPVSCLALPGTIALLVRYDRLETRSGNLVAVICACFSCLTPCTHSFFATNCQTADQALEQLVARPFDELTQLTRSGFISTHEPNCRDAEGFSLRGSSVQGFIAQRTWNV